MSRLSSAALSESGLVWHADELASPVAAVLATGHAALDAQLPGGGWPVGDMVEILQAQSGQNEWRLLLPALAASKPGPVVLVGAPHMPFGPGLAAQGLALERLLWITASEPAPRMWSCEQALCCTDVVAVLAWLPQARADQLRRLQMAAGKHAKLLFVMRPAHARTESSPAALRLLVSLKAGNDGVQLEILKRRGPPLVQAMNLPARNRRMAALLARNQGRVRNKPALALPGVVKAAAGERVGAGNALDRITSAP